MQPLVRDLIRETARKHSLPIKLVEDIIQNSFEFTVIAMKKGNRETMQFHSIRIPSFGVFKVKARWLKELNERTRLKKERERKND